MLFTSDSRKIFNMQFLSNSSGAALRGRWGSLSFPELQDLVNKEMKSLSGKKISVLEAESSPRFISLFLAHLNAGHPVVVMAEGLSEGEKALRKTMLSHPLHPQTAVIVFTSGSTGTPKAVQLSLDNLLANSEAVIESLYFKQAKSQGLFLSLSYSYGLFAQLLPALSLGVPTKIYDKFTEVREDFLDNKAEGMWSGVPSHWETLLRLTTPEHCKNITHVISAGAALPLNLRQRLRAHFPNALCFNNYGLTEASPRVLSLSSAHPRFLEEGTVGTPVKFLQVKEAEGGELWIKGRQVMLGYLGDERATQEKITDGWLHSGDIALVESDGMVCIQGRMDDLFNIGGERTSPLEIDAALLQVPGVKEGAVYVDKDALYGAKISAFLVGSEGLTKKQVLDSLRSCLSGHKIPSEFFQVHELPKTPNGKLRRAELVKLKNTGRRI